jgi:hypothetical protein
MDHIKNKSKSPIKKQASVSFADSTKPRKEGPISAPPSSKDSSSTASTNRASAPTPSKETRPTATINEASAPTDDSPQPGAFPSDLSRWMDREEGDLNQLFLYLNCHSQTVTTTPAAKAAEIVNPKSKIKIPQNIMFQALFLHQLSLAPVPPPPVTGQPKSPPKTNHTNTNTYPMPKAQRKQPKAWHLTQ